MSIDDDAIPSDLSDTADRLSRTLTAVATATPTPDHSGALLSRSRQPHRPG